MRQISRQMPRQPIVAPYDTVEIGGDDEGDAHVLSLPVARADGATEGLQRARNARAIA